MERHGNAANNLRKEIETAGKLTKKPFGVNIPLDLQQSGELIDVVLRESIDIVVTAGIRWKRTEEKTACWQEYEC